MSQAIGSVSRPISVDDLTTKSLAARQLADQLATPIMSSGTEALALERLVQALSADESTDEAYRPLCLLQLHDRAKKFGLTKDWRLASELATVTRHRNQIAHEGVA